ncbi:unnamed protein product [Didymodactylos carnosus]|uniref:arabinogalactan endo-beta-1,4-galactanase n=1 Tax=Didymodactylos carnosus TaxID=1234261 RepID=A0A8S2T6Z5_9BILA|nr:unnamed protein product [Didymodactylos carnosus]CAF4270056.1 unnamed protein product [Didymodactylos carnosus]
MIVLIDILFLFELFYSTLAIDCIGVDISHVALFEQENVVYRDYDGQPCDPFTLIKRHGINCVRLRLFTSNEQQVLSHPYDFAPTLKHTLSLARRAKENNLRILLDFHYSDTWADPGHQEKPSKWIELDFNQLKRRLYEYTRDSVQAFVDQETKPEFVQVGNEITAGILWPDGKSSNWTQFGSLLRAAIKGVRDASRQSKIILHITRATNWLGTKWFFDHTITDEIIDFDIIAQSYYPFFHGSLAALNDCLRRTAERYKKPIIIAETAFPWTNLTSSDLLVKNMTGFDTNPLGQVNYISALSHILENLPEKRGLGIFWWAAEYQPVPKYPHLGDFELRSFFNATGHPLPILRIFGGLLENSAKPPMPIYLIGPIMTILTWICMNKLIRRCR